MRIAVHDSALAAGGRLAHALTGLEERGHALVLPGGSAPPTTTSTSTRAEIGRAHV